MACIAEPALHSTFDTHSAPLNNKTLLFAIFPQIIPAWRYLLFIFSQARLLLKSSQGIFRKANLRESTRDHSREALFSVIHLCFFFFFFCSSP
jgi:hypothetical protein